ncbi:MAG: hypothetical protein AAF587_31180 [Bacteroidota bacterium]
MICETHLPRDRSVLKTYIEYFFALKTSLEKESKPDPFLHQKVRLYTQESQYQLLPQDSLEAELARIFHLKDWYDPSEEKNWQEPVPSNKRVIDIGLFDPVSKDSLVNPSPTSSDQLTIEQVKLSLLVCANHIFEQQSSLLDNHLIHLRQIEASDFSIDYYLQKFTKLHAKVQKYIDRKTQQINIRQQGLQKLATQSLSPYTPGRSQYESLYASILDQNLDDILSQLDKWKENTPVNQIDIEFVLFLSKKAQSQTSYESFSSNELSYKLHLIEIIYHLISLLERYR